MYKICDALYKTFIIFNNLEEKLVKCRFDDSVQDF